MKKNRCLSKTEIKYNCKCNQLNLFNQKKLAKIEMKNISAKTKHYANKTKMMLISFINDFCRKNQ